MELAMIGLGRMGMNMARRLLKKGHKVYAYNRTKDKIDKIAQEGAIPLYNIEDIPQKMSAPRHIWIMLPAGKIVDAHIEMLIKILSPGDTIIEGGNSYYKDSMKRASYLKDHGINFIDAGVSGGIWGLKEGYCIMAGGEPEVFEDVEPIIKDLAPEDGYLLCGPPGAGHFVKMVHNGIEYGIMQAYAEGFDILHASPFEQTFDFEKIAKLWNRGSVIRSWLLELLELAFQKEPRLLSIAPYVEDSGEGRWTVQQAVESGVAAPVITLSLFNRFQSREENSFRDRILAALRQEFGGHAVKRREAAGKTK